MKNIKKIFLTLIITMVFGITNVYAEEQTYSDAFNSIFPEGKFETTIYKQEDVTLNEEEINLYSQVINKEIKDTVDSKLDETYSLDFDAKACLTDSTKCNATLTQIVAEPVEEPATSENEETTEPSEEKAPETIEPVVESHQVEIVYAELTEAEANEVATVKSALEENNHFLVVGENEFDFLNSLMTENGSYDEIIDYSEDFDSFRETNSNIDYLFTKTDVTKKDAYNNVSGRLSIYYRNASGKTILVGYANITVEEQMTLVIPENYYDEEGTSHDIVTADEIIEAFKTRLKELYNKINLESLRVSSSSISTYNFDDMTLDVPSGKTKAEVISSTYEDTAVEVTYNNLTFKVLLKKDNSAITRTVEYKDATTKAKKTIELAHNTIINVYAENELDINEIIVNDNIEIEDLSREFYVFIGYEKTTNEEGQLVFTPVFELVNFEIIYKNMDNAINNNPTTYTIETATFSLTAPSKEGYIFTGWTTADSEELLNTITIEQGSTGNKEFTANWKIKTYTITYKDYETGKSEEITLKYGDTISVCKSKDECEKITINDKTRLSTPENPGHIFKGFTKSEENNQVVLTANYEVEEYTITYEGIDNDTTGNPTKYTVESEDINLVAPEKEGYIFTGWTSEDNTEPTLDLTIPKGTTGNKTYRANWEEAGMGEVGEEEEEEPIVTEPEEETVEEPEITETITKNNNKGTKNTNKPAKTDDTKIEDKTTDPGVKPVEETKNNAPILFIIAGCIIFVAIAGFIIYYLTSREEKNN